MPSEPTGWEASVAAAELRGWSELARNPNAPGYVGLPPTGRREWKPIPAWHLSLDACFRDLIPTVEEQGWSWLLDRESCELRRGEEIIEAYAATPAEAICRAFRWAQAADERRLPSPAEPDR